jgi:hypothetical protein
MSKEAVINYTDIIPENVNFTKLEENERSNGQLIGYPRYLHNGTEGKMLIQLPWTKLTTYGVPQLNQYYKTDAERAHVRIPIDLSNPEHVEFADKIKAIDSHMASEETKDKLLGKKGKKYKYQPMYREALVSNDDDDDDDDEDVKKPKKQTSPRPPYIKLKILIDYNSKEVKTDVWQSEMNSENKRERSKLDNIKSIDDFAAVVKYQSSIRCVAEAFKCWAHPLTKKDPEYGIALRIKRVEVEKSTMGGKYPMFESSDNFIDSDTEAEIPVIKAESSTKAERKVLDEDSDNSDNEIAPEETRQAIVDVDSDDSDEEVIVKPKTRKVPVKAKK